MLHEHAGSWCCMEVQLEARCSTFFCWYQVLLIPGSLFESSILSHLPLISSTLPVLASKEDSVLKIMFSCPLLLEECDQEMFLVAQPRPNCCCWIQSFASAVWNCISYSHCYLHNAVSLWWLFYLCFPYFKAEEAASWSCEIEAPTSYWAVLFMGMISFYHPLGVRILSEW